MKKILSLLLAALLLTGCAAGEPAALTEPASAPEEASQAGTTLTEQPLPDPAEETVPQEPLSTAETLADPMAFLEEIRPALDCLRSCDLEVYGADMDYTREFYAGYRNGKLAVLYEDTQPLPQGYEQDPAYASYYRIQNYQSLSDVYDWLSRYMTPTAQAQLQYVEENFLEYEGQLYLCRGGRGYGALASIPDTAVYAQQDSQGRPRARVDYYLFDEYSHAVLLTFQEGPEGWMIADMEEIWE